MKRWPSLLRTLALFGVSAGLTGCPLVLQDDFSTLPADAAGTNAGGKSEGGQGASGGTTGASDAGSGAATMGGEPGMTVAGNGGNKPVAGTAGMGATSGEAGAGGDGGQGGAPDPCSLCSPDEECCEGSCVDTRFDSLNCRECGMGCPGTTCDNSSCTNTCVQGSIDCNRNIVDGCEVNPAVDPKNCGNCGIPCGFGLECVAGYCVCPPATADCDGDSENGCEVDTSSNELSCGGCGKPCAANEECVASACDCAVGFADCNMLPEDGCEADLTSVATCGSCQLDCGPHGSCVAAGQCDCQPGYLECDDQALGCETPVTDPSHCGDCDTSCTAGTPVCDGTTCVDGCNGLTRCGDSCVDTDIDPAHCGDCEQPVGANQICAGGLPECATGFDDCDADPNDCEINTQTDVNHCGACGDACKSGAVCNMGSCGCAPATPNDCGATCEQCCNDGQCSDGDSCTADVCAGGLCDNGGQCEGAGGLCCSGTGCFDCCSDGDCDVGEVCSGNQCVLLSCTLPEILCDSQCVNSSTDANNCGGCGNKCGPGRTCSGAVCTPKWVATAAPPAGFVNREKAAYAAMGSKVFVWGGNNSSGTELNTGAVYDPDANTWSAVGSGGTPPSARVLATAVWTGSVMVVWGGGDADSDNDYNTGSRYDPATDTWAVMSTVGAPTGRRAAYGFWTGSRVLFYSGFDQNGTPLSGAYLYDPANNTWWNGDTDGRPNGRNDPTTSWNGTLLTVYGGRIGSNYYSDTYLYELATDDWDDGANGPSNRAAAFGGWDGSYHLVWSGYSANSQRSDGKLYDPATNVWTSMLSQGQPTPRSAPHRYTGWSARIKPRVTLMLGGYDANGFRVDGGIYSSITNAWSTVSAWPSATSHLWGVGVWTGTEFVLWGGRQGTTSSLTASGERYRP
ncbi:MAG TPA: kelch repeat-containing protein [Polyangiaceae bacterium]|nr:kelch repeat-containing protein [Polyangiaceae bacterium]